MMTRHFQTQQSYDSIIVLANLMDQQGMLNDQSKGRMDLGVKLLNFGRAPLMVTCGWAYRSDTSINIADAMRNYAIQHYEIPEKAILTEVSSRDTVGDAVFTKLNYANLQGWKRILIVTSDYHVTRTKLIFNFVYGAKFEVEVVGAETDVGKGMDAAEAKSLEAFQRTFSEIEPGDDEAILKRLCQSHPFYNGEILPRIQGAN